MTTRPVPQADWTRCLNTIGKDMGVNALIPLDDHTLLQVAESRTGLSDFGDSGFRQHLAVLTRSLQEEANLSLTGRLLAVCNILRILESRLRIVDTEKKHPEISREKIEGPIFVLGMGRSGTTILHELLAQDPANRAPLFWEMIFPAPPREYGESPEERLVVADAFMKILDEIDSSYISKHEGAGDLANEYFYMMLHEFLGTSLFGTYGIPSYAFLCSKADHTPAYQMHKRILQMLQWRHEAKRWVLKDPGHLSMLPTLLKVYPDAKIVHTHRDPGKVVRSLTSLTASLRLMSSDQFDAGAVVEKMNKGQAFMLEKTIKERESGIVPESQIIDVFFSDFLSDPVGEVEKLYAHWGIEFTLAAKEAMQDYMEARPRAKHGEHEYACSDAVDIDKERKRYRRYMDHYGLENE